MVVTRPGPDVPEHLDAPRAQVRDLVVNVGAARRARATPDETAPGLPDSVPAGVAAGVHDGDLWQLRLVARQQFARTRRRRRSPPRSRPARSARRPSHSSPRTDWPVAASRLRLRAPQNDGSRHHRSEYRRRAPHRRLFLITVTVQNQDDGKSTKVPSPSGNRRSSIDNWRLAPPRPRATRSHIANYGRDPTRRRKAKCRINRPGVWWAGGGRAGP